jgi:F0F1-type ATP synthase assembly protein I
VPRDAPGWPALLGMGLVIALLFVAGLALGWFLDRVLHTSPVLAIVGLALGLAAGVYYSIVQFRTFMKE